MLWKKEYIWNEKERNNNIAKIQGFSDQLSKENES